MVYTLDRRRGIPKHENFRKRPRGAWAKNVIGDELLYFSGPVERKIYCDENPEVQSISAQDKRVKYYVRALVEQGKVPEPVQVEIPAGHRHATIRVKSTGKQEKRWYARDPHAMKLHEFKQKAERDERVAKHGWEAHSADSPVVRGYLRDKKHKKEARAAAKNGLRNGDLGQTGDEGVGEPVQVLEPLIGPSTADQVGDGVMALLDRVASLNSETKRAFAEMANRMKDLVNEWDDITADLMEELEETRPKIERYERLRKLFEEGV